MYCNKCGKHNPENSNYCKYCGSKIVKMEDGKTKEKEDNKVEHENKINTKKVKAGFTGWLALLALGIIINPFIYGYNLYGYFPLFNENYNIPGYLPLLQIEFVMMLIFFVSSVYFLFLFFNKKSKFPKFYFIFLISVSIFAVADILVAYGLFGPYLSQSSELDKYLSNTTTSYGRTIILSILWAIYLKKSKQVKATFIND